jgi:hypothetical protein
METITITEQKIVEFFGNMPEGVNEYNKNTTREQWNEYPSLMVERFCLLFGSGNGVSDYTTTERVERLKRIDITIGALAPTGQYL